MPGGLRRARPLSLSNIDSKRKRSRSTPRDCDSNMKRSESEICSMVLKGLEHGTRDKESAIRKGEENETLEGGGRGKGNGPWRCQRF